MTFFILFWIFQKVNKNNIECYDSRESFHILEFWIVWKNDRGWRQIFLCFQIFGMVYFSSHSISQKFRNHTFSTFSSQKCLISSLFTDGSICTIRIIFVLNVWFRNFWKRLNGSENLLYVWFRNTEKFLSQARVYYLMVLLWLKFFGQLASRVLFYNWL